MGRSKAHDQEEESIRLAYASLHNLADVTFGATAPELREQSPTPIGVEFGPSQETTVTPESHFSLSAIECTKISEDGMTDVVVFQGSRKLP